MPQPSACITLAVCFELVWWEAGLDVTVMSGVWLETDVAVIVSERNCTATRDLPDLVCGMVRESQRQKAVRILPAPIDARHETAVPQLNCDIFLTRRHCEGSMIRQNVISVYQETPFITTSGLVLMSLVGL